jgi:hypothetical protein
MRAQDVSGTVIAVIAIAALLLMIIFVRGTDSHSRYDDAPASAAIEVIA